MALSTEAQARIIAQLVKEEFDRIDQKESDQIAILKTANANLTKMVTDLTDSVRSLQTDLTESNDAHVKMTDALANSVTTQGDTIGLLEERDTVGLVEDTIKTFMYPAVTKALEAFDLPKQVSDACDTLWDESWQHKMASMIPDLDEHDGHLDKRFIRVDEALALVNTRMDTLSKTQGPPGKDVDHDVVVGTLYDRIMSKMDDLILHHMPGTVPGPKGDPGTDGKSVDVESLLDDVKSYVDKKLPTLIPDATPGPKGAPGADAPSTKDVADMLLSHTPIVKMVAESDEVGRLVGENVENLLPSHIPDAIPGPKGDPGADGKSVSIDDVKEFIPDAIPGPKGAPGADAEVNVLGIIDEVLKDQRMADGISGMIDVAMPAPVKGDPGQDGVDRPILDVVEVDEDERVEKGTMVAHSSGLWMTKRRSKGTPTQDPAAYLLVAGGLVDVEMETLDERTIRVRHLMTDGDEKIGYINTHAIMHRGLWKIGGEYDFNDEAMINGSTFRCVVPQTKSRPGDDGDWKLVSQGKPGKKGVPGDKGLPGETGRGVVDTTVVKQGRTLFITTTYSDGTSDVSEIDFDDPEGDKE